MNFFSKLRQNKKINLIYAEMIKVLWYVYGGQPIYPSCKKVKLKIKKIKSTFQAKILFKTPTNILV
jgi:hypothetical protein